MGLDARKTSDTCEQLIERLQIMPDTNGAVFLAGDTQ